MKHETKRSIYSRQLHVALACACLLVGCSNGATQPGTPLPPPPAPSNATAYIGTQAPGYWDFSVDDTQNVFSYQSLTGSTAATSGALASTNGVLDFGDLKGAPLGKAVAQPAGGALLRPGGPATYPVAMIQQSDCVPVTGKLRYIYAALLDSQFIHSGSNQTEAGYGTFVVSTNGNGKSWNFDDVHSYVLTSAGYAAGTENGFDPNSFTATCTSSGGVGTVNADANPAFPPDAKGNPQPPPSFHFNPAGGFLEERNSGASWAGFVMPALPVKPSDVASGSYRGFVFEGTVKAPVDSRPVAFAQPSTGGSILAGGVFPGDDLTQTPGSEYTITLGKQDGTLNGVFPNAKFTALDINGYCAQVAPNDPNLTITFDANGSEICSSNGVGVVSQLGGKYVVYFTSHDGTRDVSNNVSYVIQFYLYQQ